MKTKKTHFGIAIFIGMLLIAFAFITLSFFWVIGSNSYAKSCYEKQNLIDVKLITDKSIGKIEEVNSMLVLEIAIDQPEYASIPEEPDQAAIPEEPDLAAIPEEPDQVADSEGSKLAIKPNDGNSTIYQEVKKSGKKNSKKELALELKQSYDQIMESQKQENLRMIEDLILQGKAEWQGIVASGEDTPIVKGEKVSEYLAMINIMENNMDKSFETVLAKMKEQFEAMGIDAEPILETYQQEYDETKDEYRKIMFDKAVEAIKGE